MQLFQSFILLIIGFVFPIKGADFFVDGSASIANIAVLRTLRVELRVSGLPHAALRPFDPRLAFRYKPFDSALRHSLRRGDDDIRVRRFDAQVHVFDGFAHDGHPHAVGWRGAFYHLGAVRAGNVILNGGKMHGRSLFAQHTVALALLFMIAYQRTNNAEGVVQKQHFSRCLQLIL